MLSFSVIYFFILSGFCFFIFYFLLVCWSSLLDWLVGWLLGFVSTFSSFCVVRCWPCILWKFQLIFCTMLQLLVFCCFLLNSQHCNCPRAKEIKQGFTHSKANKSFHILFFIQFFFSFFFFLKFIIWNEIGRRKLVLVHDINCHYE